MHVIGQVNPRLFVIALIEYLSGTVTGPGFTPDLLLRPLVVEVDFRTGLLRQLVWVAEALNYGYYSWKDGSLTELQFSDGSSQRIDPWQNGGTVALHYLFSQWYPPGEFEKAISPQGFAATYRKLFGEPFALAVNHIPGNLRQPELGCLFHQTACGLTLGVRIRLGGVLGRLLRSILRPRRLRKAVPLRWSRW